MHLPELEYDWTRIYGNVLEEIPKDAPEPLGKSVTTTTFLDANLLHDLITGRSVTAVLHFFNLTPGDWYSKRQATVENATYGSEFVVEGGWRPWLGICFCGRLFLLDSCGFWIFWMASHCSPPLCGVCAYVYRS